MAKSKTNPVVVVGDDSRAKAVLMGAISCSAAPDTRVFLFGGAAVRIVVTVDELTWFVVVDVCAVLGIANPTQAVQPLDDDEKAMFNIGLPGGPTNCITESGFYALVMRSRKPEAKRFAKWVRSEVLPSIRKTGAYTMPAAPDPVPAVPTQVTATGDLALVQAAATLLNYSPSSKLAALQRVAKNHGLDRGLLPSYTVDAPDPNATSSEVTKSATVLLKETGVEMGATAFYVALASLGFMRRDSRKTKPSTRHPDGVKGFWVIVGPGLKFGKNIASPQCPREVQPHWYEHRFADLLDIVRNADTEGA
ncbi:BRO-N domain-containing protein [Paraburkholderia sp. CI3]|uniref:BRO-N domain-containing protein n=1 Tax=Paraburkholderia sp. CI3 TaxID=2991060 RepID=UPI003D1B5B58